MLGQLLRKKVRGSMYIDIALSPWAVFFTFLGFYLIAIVISIGAQSLFFISVEIQGARLAAVDSDLNGVQNRVYASVTKALPATSSGITLITKSDIQINQYDGPYVTTKMSYKAMMPGTKFARGLGIPPSSMLIPLSKSLSYLREYN